MKFVEFIVFCALFSVGCGSNDSQLTSLTDMKSVLLYQHVAADRFRLLACPYAVDLNIARDCSNVFFTPAGDEYYLTGIPQQPQLFAPSHKTVKRLMTVPLVVAGAAVSWVVLRRLRSKIDVDAVRKKLLDGAPQSKDADNAAKTAKGVAKTTDEAVEQAAQLDAASYRKLAKDLDDLIKDKKKLFQEGGVDKGDTANGDEAVKFEEIAATIKAEIDFMGEQFEIVSKAIKQYKTYDELFPRILAINKPKEPRKIFENFKKVYGNSANNMLESYSKNRGLKLKNNKANEIIEKMRQHGDEIIEGEEDILHKLTRLIERPDILKTIRANRSKDRGITQVAEVQAVESRAKEIVENSTDAHKNGGIADYLIAAVGGLLTGSYLPDKIPQLENHLFTEREWKKLFARDDSFKKPMRVTDSYAVVKKLTRYLKHKGEKVVINEQVFFGLKN